jgi:hypothetical protein
MHRLDAVMPVAAEAAAKLEVPENTGDLKGSIKANVAEREGDKIEASISAGDYKANWYENGTGARRSKRIKHARTRAAAGRREQKRQDIAQLGLDRRRQSAALSAQGSIHRSRCRLP